MEAVREMRVHAEGGGGEGGESEEERSKSEVKRVEAAREEDKNYMTTWHESRGGYHTSHTQNIPHLEASQRRLLHESVDNQELNPA